MVADGGPSLSEALTRFIAAKKNGKTDPQNHQELGRFVAWCGRERNVVEVTPSEVADYAQYIGLGGPESGQRLTPVKTFLGYWKDEGWIQNGLSAHLRLPRGRRAAGKRSGNSANSPENAFLSQEGFDKLTAQLVTLRAERTGVIEDIRQAMEDKDFRENAPLEAAKEQQGLLESRIRELESSLASAQILSAKPRKALQKAALGTKVTLKDVASGKKMVYTLVDVREADIASGKISTSSPVGQAVLDKRVGEEFTINVPRGARHLLVEKIDS